MAFWPGDILRIWSDIWSDQFLLGQKKHPKFSILKPHILKGNLAEIGAMMGVSWNGNT